MEKENKSIITKKDVLILQKLLEDGRKSSASISKEIDLGREIVNYRIKRLIKENLILKFIPKINENILNYKEYIILLKLNLDDELSKDKFIKEKIGNKYLSWTIKSKSGWDLLVRLYAESVDEFKVKLEEILEEFSSVLANYYTIISSDEIKEDEKKILVENLFKSNMQDYKLIKNTDVLNYDSKDKEILEILEEDARIQYSEISKRVNLSSDTVKYRIDKMKSSGLIENIEPVINFNKLGFISAAAILRFNFLKKEQEQQVYEFLINHEKISKAIKSLNSEEYFLNLIFKNEEEIKEFEKEIKNKFKEKLNNVEIFKI